MRARFILLLTTLSLITTSCTDRTPPPPPPQPPTPQPQPEPPPPPPPPDPTLTSIYLPTGDRNTSLLLVEHLAPKADPPPRAGEAFDYRIRLTNLSTSCALESVTLRQALPHKTVLIASDPPSAGRESDEQVWIIDRIDPGDTAEIRATAAASGELTESPTCIRVTYAPALCATIPLAPPRAELTRIAPEVWSACELLPIRYRLTNLTDDHLPPAVVREPLPEGLIGATTDGQLTVRFPALTPRQTHEESVLLRVAHPGHYEGRAVAEFENGARVVSNAATTTAAQALLAVSLDAPAVHHAGAPIHYRAAVTNSGTGPAQGARLQVRIPEHTRILDPAGADVGDGFAVVPIGDIPAGRTAHASFTLLQRDPGDLAITAEAVAPCSRAADAQDTPDAPPRAVATTRLLAPTPITLQLADDPDPAPPGSQIVYEIILTNQSGAPDTNIAVTATIPPGFELIDAAGQTDPVEPRGPAPPDHDAAPRTIAFHPLDRLVPGQRAIWYLRATTQTPGEHRFIVEIASDTLPRPLVAVERTTVR